MKKFFYLITLAVLVPYTAVLTSCSKEDEVKKDNINTSYTLNYNESVTINSKKTIEVKNSFIASYDNGVLTGNHVGTTTATYDGNKTIAITVNGTMNYIEYPATNWGSSSINHKSGVLVDGSSSSNKMYNVSVNGYVKYIYMYNFDSAQRLTGSAVLVPVSDVYTLTDWLSQKYFLVPYSTGDIASMGLDAYKTEDATTILAIAAKTMTSSKFNIFTKYWYMIAFLPASSTRSAFEKPTETHFVDEMLNNYGFITE